MARKNAATEKNIISAWQKSGLFLIQPKVVFDRLRLKASESQLIKSDSESEKPPDVTITASNDDFISIPFTPRNVKHVNQLVQQIKAGNYDSALPEKLGKAYSSAIAISTLLTIINDDLIQAE